MLSVRVDGSVTRLVLAHRYARVRILLIDPTYLVQETHRLVELGRRLVSFVEFRRVHREYRQREDGFLIAEKDLELRGGGEVLGARQSGLPEFRIANVPGFELLLAAARDDARLLLHDDPSLTGPRGTAVRTLLYLFECDDAVRLFRAA